MIIILFFVAHWYLSLFAQTFFHHRYAAHRAFTMSKGWEKFFFVYSYCQLKYEFYLLILFLIYHFLLFYHSNYYTIFYIKSPYLYSLLCIFQGGLTRSSLLTLKMININAIFKNSHTINLLVGNYKL